MICRNRCTRSHVLHPPPPPTLFSWIADCYAISGEGVLCLVFNMVQSNNQCRDCPLSRRRINGSVAESIVLGGWFRFAEQGSSNQFTLANILWCGWHDAMRWWCGRGPKIIMAGGGNVIFPFKMSIYQVNYRYVTIWRNESSSTCSTRDIRQF